MRQSKIDRLADALGERIRSGAYPAGSALPSERDLTDEFQVSRVTVRSALERLESGRVVERSPGRGTYVIGSDAPRHAAVPRLGPIALVSSQLTPSVASPVAAGCSSAALAHRAQLILCDTGGTTFAEAQAKEAIHLQNLYEHGVAGVVIWWQEGEASRPWLERLLDSGVPVVMVDRCVDGLAADFVGIDDEAAAFDATRHLIRLGHRRIAAVLHSLRVTVSQDRLAGYRRALREHGLDGQNDLVLAVEEGRADAGATAVETLMEIAEPPTAFVAINDYVAVAIIDALAERGIIVPADAATVSFADMEIASHYRVPLTTVRQPFRAMGETAVHVVWERIQTGRTEPKRILMPTSLIVRQSCGSDRAR